MEYTQTKLKQFWDLHSLGENLTQNDVLQAFSNSGFNITFMVLNLCKI